MWKRVFAWGSAQRFVLLCAAIASVGLALRWHRYGEIPSPARTADEFAFTWLGMSLLQNGYPESWSWLEPYGDVPVVEWQGRPYRIVRPWFDHPPLFSLLPGTAAIMCGAKTYFEVELRMARMPMLILGTLSILLLFTVARQLFGHRAALLAAIVYALNPSVVYLSRLVVSENFITILMLVMLYCYSRYVQNNATFHSSFLPAVFVASIASWAKLPGFSLVIALTLLAIYHRQWREACFAMAVGITFVLLQIAYAAAFDLKLFVEVMLAHADRMEQFTIVNDLTMVEKSPFQDYFGLYCLFILVSATTIAKRSAPFIIIPAFSYVLTLICMGAQSHWYEWYQIPLLPLFAMCFGLVNSTVSRRRDLVHPLLLVFVLLTWSVQMLATPGLFVRDTPLEFVKLVFIEGMCGLFLIYVLCAATASRSSRGIRTTLSLAVLAIYLCTCALVAFNLQLFFEK